MSLHRPIGRSEYVAQTGISPAQPGRAPHTRREVLKYVAAQVIDHSRPGNYSNDAGTGRRRACGASGDHWTRSPKRCPLRPRQPARTARPPESCRRSRWRAPGRRRSGFPLRPKAGRHALRRHRRADRHGGPAVLRVRPGYDKSQRRHTRGIRSRRRSGLSAAGCQIVTLRAGHAGAET